MKLLERASSMTGHDEPAWERTRLRVPREDGTFFVEPSPSVIRERLNRLKDESPATVACSECRILNQPLADFRTEARAEVLAAASEWTSELMGRSIQVDGTAPLIMTGHQPELFHPGVFAKNIATSLLANWSGGAGLNLVVDNDLMTGTRVQVPFGNRHSPGLSTVEFDTPRAPVPWEDARIANQDTFASFGDRVAKVMRPWGIEPLITECWPAVVERAVRHQSQAESVTLAECLTAGRVSLEQKWNHGNLELPISRLCETNAFRAFAAHVILNAESFGQVYNEVLTEYRQVHRIRSVSHPVPELQLDGHWCETPFWVWKANDPRRGRLFVRRSNDAVDLATSPNSESIIHHLPLTQVSSCTEAVRAFSDLTGAGIRLRTRALTTTLFTRICLCDLFVHGIGGAKYDAMTDRISRRFFGIFLPEYLTLSATWWLPLGAPHAVTEADLSRLQQMLRELQQNPQRHLGPHPAADAQRLVQEKLELIEQQQRADSIRASGEVPPRGHRRYRRFSEINRELAKQTNDQQDAIRQEIAATELRLAANRILTSREFSFCLYPADVIRTMVDRLETHLIDPV